MVTAFGVRRPLRSVSLAFLILPVAERLGEEAFALTEGTVRERAALAISEQSDIGRQTKHLMGTVLHDVRNVADLYPIGIKADLATQEEALALKQ